LQLSTASIVSAELRELADKEIAASRTWFFKTGKGEYGFGDLFLGIEVPAIRQVAKKHQELALDQIKKLATSKYHEERFIALAIVVLQFKKAKAAAIKKQLFDTYLELLKANRVNNWDLVDASAPYLGVYLLDFQGAKALLAKLAKSRNLWEQRASIMFTWAHIRAGQLEVSTKQVELFLNHPHDLIHKAAGWMLREVGKKDLKLLRNFLDAHAAIMPRVMLRYAIEKMTETERAKWLRKANG
jgi:3-methyladenine DNA glycosylase AlkD